MRKYFVLGKSGKGVTNWMVEIGVGVVWLGEGGREATSKKRAA